MMALVSWVCDKTVQWSSKSMCRLKFAVEWRENLAENENEKLTEDLCEKFFREGKFSFRIPDRRKIVVQNVIKLRVS